MVCCFKIGMNQAGYIALRRGIQDSKSISFSCFGARLYEILFCSHTTSMAATLAPAMALHSTSGFGTSLRVLDFGSYSLSLSLSFVIFSCFIFLSTYVQCTLYSLWGLDFNELATLELRSCGFCSFELSFLLCYLSMCTQKLT